MDKNYNKQEDNFYDHSNLKLDKRTFELNIGKGQGQGLILDDRKIFEQYNAYNNNGNKNYNKFNNNKNIGEITGDLFDITEIDKGMPFRSNYNTAKKRTPEQDKDGYNRYTDFDIFEEKEQTNFDISYYDPNGAGMFNFDEITEKSILTNSDPLELVNYTINDFNWYMLENIRNLLRENTFYLTIGIMNLMSTLYIGSSGQTENYLLNYFNFSEKNIIHDGLQQINEYINKSQCFDMKNIIVTKNNIINNSFVNHMEKICDIIVISNNNPNQEASKINTWLNKIYGNLLGTVMSEDHIKKMNTTCLCVGLLRTVWKIPFDRILKRPFNKNVNSTVNNIKKIRELEFMYNSGKAYNYFEDNTSQIMEIPFYDNTINMGIIMPKDNPQVLPKFGLKDFDVFISNMKMTIMDEVLIPKFVQHSKMRISSILKKTGLDNLFTQMNISELTNNSIILSDVIQNMYIIVDNKHIKYGNDDEHTRGVNSKRSFIVDKPFIYYFRCVQTNTIIITGLFY